MSCRLSRPTLASFSARAAPTPLSAVTGTVASSNSGGYFGAELKFAGYDAIVCADVLEHIRQSPRVLAECRALLAPGGRLLLSIPNAGYSGLVAELMAGEFRYRTEGLLDETHVRFFTRRTLLRFLAEHGWAVECTEAITRQLPDSEFKVAFDALPPAVARHLLALPDALTYQFIVVARPAQAGRREAGEVLAVDDHLARVGAFEQVDEAQQGGFAGAREADDPVDLAFGHDQAGGAQAHHVAAGVGEAARDAAQFDGRFRRGCAWHGAVQET